MCYQWQFFYSTLLLPFLRIMLQLLAFTHPKTRASLAGRKGLWQRINQQMQQRHPHKPLIWFHVASAGEYLQALPLINQFDRNHYQFALTVTSVTGFKWATKPQAVHPLTLIDYLPFDTQRNMQRLLSILKPAAIIYVKFDLWPNLIWEAHKNQVPQFLISATLQPQSKRFNHPLGRAFYRSIYQCLTGIYTVSTQDQQRFLRTNPHHPAICNMGDTRFDSVVERKRSIRAPQLPTYIKENPVVILGSSWPSDEKYLFPVLHKALKVFPQLVVMHVPHEINTQHLQETAQYFSAYHAIRYTQLELIKDHTLTPQPRVIIVDRVGLLSALYVYANIAYVGGAFGKGLHNVMEPSVMGVPTIFGPNYTNAPEAVELLANQQCFSINNQQALEHRLFELLANPAQCKHLGQTTAAYIEQRAGAATKCHQLIEETLHA